MYKDGGTEVVSAHLLSPRETPRLVAIHAALPDSWRVRPLLLVHAALLLLLVANLGRIPVLSTGDREAPLLINDLCLLVVSAVGVLYALVGGSLRIDLQSGLAILFAGIGGASALYATHHFGLAGSELIVGLAYLARWIVYFGLYVVVTNVATTADIVPLWRALERTILLFAAFGIVQAIFLPRFAQLVYPDSRAFIDWDEQGHRLVSTVLEPNIAGAMIMLVLLVHLAQLAMGARVSSWKPLLLVAAVIATLSRSSVLGLLVGGAIVIFVRGLSRRMIKRLAALAGLMLLTFPLILKFGSQYNKFTVDASAMARFSSWARAIRILADNPLFGVGFNTYPFVQERYGYMRMGTGTYSTDGGLLFVAVMTGLVGLGVYLAMLWVVIRRCRAVWRDPDASEEWKALATGIAAGTAGICVHSIFVNSLMTTFVMEPLWLLWALAFLMSRALRSGGVSSGVPPTPVAVSSPTAGHSLVALVGFPRDAGSR